MRTICVQSMYLVLELDEENLASFDSLHLSFDLVAIIQVELGQVLELELLSHSFAGEGVGSGQQRCSWSGSFCRGNSATDGSERSESKTTKRRPKEHELVSIGSKATSHISRLHIAKRSTARVLQGNVVMPPLC